MFGFHYFLEGLRNLTYSKLRSALALIGVLVGTASVVAMVLGGELATFEALKQFRSLGTNLLAVSIRRSENDFGAAKTEELMLNQAWQLGLSHPQVERAAPYTQVFRPITYQGESLNGMVLGVTADFADIAKLKLAQGRMVTAADRYAYYCVIGSAIYKKLQRHTFHNPIGQRIQLGDHVFVIVGVLKPWPENSFIYADVNHSVLIPILASTAISQYAGINNVIVRLQEHAKISTVEKTFTQTLATMLPNKKLLFRSAKELIKKMKKQNDIMTMFLGLIGSVSLLVGGIGVMNIMLVSVVERKREIGIRLAVGAKQRDIGLLFLAEAIMLSLTGGLLGVLVGVGVAYAIALYSGWQFILFWWPILAGFSVSVLVGVFFGFYPALSASRLRPIEALRTD